MQPELISVAEAARIAKVDPKSVRRWYRERRITKYKDDTGRVQVDAREIRDRITPKPVEVGR
jgi:predicted site-specific integrase-resolvase